MSNNEAIKTGANIQADAAGVSAQGNVLAGDTIQSTKDFVGVFRELCTKVLMEMPTILTGQENRINDLTNDNRSLTITCGSQFLIISPFNSMTIRNTPCAAGC